MDRNQYRPNRYVRDDGTTPTDSTDTFGPRRTPPAAATVIRTERGGTVDDVRRYASTRNQQQQQEQEQEQSDYNDIPAPPPDMSTIEGYLTEVDNVSSLIQRSNQRIERLAQLQGQALDLATTSSTTVQREQQELQSCISTENKHIKKRIQDMMKSNGKSPDAKIRHAQANRLKQDFMNLIQKYQDMERTFSQKYRQQVARQIRIVKPDVTEDEIDAIIDSDEADQVFAQSLLKSNRTGQARSVLSEVQTRHDDIKRIERTLLELHQLFIDMQMLIEQQGEVLTEVEDQVVAATSDIEKGVHHVDQAIKSAKATRTKKWCCFVIFIIILILAAFCIWWFAFNHKGVGN